MIGKSPPGRRLVDRCRHVAQLGLFCLRQVIEIDFARVIDISNWRADAGSW